MLDWEGGWCRAVPVQQAGARQTAAATRLVPLNGVSLSRMNAAQGAMLA